MVHPLRQPVVFQPAASHRMQQGIHKIVAAVRPTLGPRSRVVAVERDSRVVAPELLDDAGLIARRIIELPDRDEDVGAMLTRHLIWRVRDRAGDGAATAAVLFQSIYDQALAYLTAGGDAVLLRAYLDEGCRLAVDTLAGVVQPIRGKQKLANLALALCQDAELAHLLGEIFDLIGEWGRLEVRSGNGRDLEREYVEGMYWEAAPGSREMLSAPHRLRVDLDDAAILVTDFTVQDLDALASLLADLKQAGVRSLLWTVRELFDAASGLLLANNKPGEFQVVVVKVPYGSVAKSQALLTDLALLTGGRAFTREAGQTIRSVTMQDLGRARRAWADQTHFGIVGGSGDPKALRRHLTTLQAGFTNSLDTEIRQELRERIGKMVGGSATLWIGGANENEINLRKERAERTADALRGALLEGIVPGGGVALLQCRTSLRKALASSRNPDERAAYRILVRALEEPTRTIVYNAGGNPGEVLAAINRSAPGCGYDVHSEQVVDMLQAGIGDTTRAVSTALISAVTTAALALTTQVLVHRKIRIGLVNP